MNETLIGVLVGAAVFIAGFWTGRTTAPREEGDQIFNDNRTFTAHAGQVHGGHISVDRDHR
jgi:hypothetical protein